MSPKPSPKRQTADPLCHGSWSKYFTPGIFSVNGLWHPSQRRLKEKQRSCTSDQSLIEDSKSAALPPHCCVRRRVGFTFGNGGVGLLGVALFTSLQNSSHTKWPA